MPDDLNIVGTASNDSLSGGTGNDTLSGLDGNDQLQGGAGNDSADGGAGNDTLYGNAGNDTLLGGDGNDYLYDTQGANVLSGGAGNDTISNVSNGDTGSTLQGGGGQDWFRINSSGVASEVRYNASALHPDVVADFQTGPGGDVLDLSGLSSYGVIPNDHGNPFLTGHLQFVQSGADTVLQANADVTGATTSWVTVLTLQNTSASAFTADNIAQGWNPQGTAGELVSDSDYGNTLSGGPNDDTLHGNGGPDSILGGDGNDSLDGGEGNDTLYGGFGDDTLAGGTGNDYLSGDDGNDSADGGAGNDTLYSSAGDDTLAGGGGNNSLYDTQGANSLSGGLGNDTLSEVSGGDTGSTLSGGAGQDTFRFSGNVGYDLQYSPSALHVDVVTDFQTGPGGDVLDMSGLQSYGAVPGNANPFTTGYAQFVQSGVDTLLQVDKAGTGGPRDGSPS